MEMITNFPDFYRHIRIFLSDLLTYPFKAEPSHYLKARGFNRARLIRLLLKKDVITEKERVTVKDTEDGRKKVEHTLKYTVKRENFERKIKRIYIQFFEKNVINIKQETEEENG